MKIHNIIISNNFAAKVPCFGVCSFGCAVIEDEEQCFCPTGFELDGSNRTQCIG